jgi:hypothetical protein
VYSEGDERYSVVEYRSWNSYSSQGKYVSLDLSDRLQEDANEAKCAVGGSGYNSGNFDAEFW